MTFRPYADHERSAHVLDRQRLGKQRLESYQIAVACLATLTGESGGWTNHPVVRMWAGRTNPYLDHACGRVHLRDLLDYYDAIVREWRQRGYRHNMEYRVLPLRITLEYEISYPDWFTPHPLPWGATQELQHKHILLRKDPVYYGRFWKPKVSALPTFREEGPGT